MATSLSIYGPPSNTRFLRPIRPHNPNGIPIGSVVFAQTTVECPDTLQWDAHSPPPQNLPLPIGDLNPYLIHGSLGSPKSSTQTAAALAGLSSVTDRPTDRPTDHTTWSVRIGCIYVYSTVMRPIIFMFLLIMMVFTNEYRILIKYLRQDKCHSTSELLYFLVHNDLIHHSVDCCEYKL